MVFERYRDKNGEMSRKYGNTLIRILRKHYGDDFAAGCANNEKLSDVLHKLDELSLSRLVRDLESGRLEKVCRQAVGRAALSEGPRRLAARKCFRSLERE